MRTAALLTFALATVFGAQLALAYGGDDITVLSGTVNVESDLAIASDGTQFAAVMWDNGDGHSRITVRRSTDGGTTWSTWATFYDSAVGHRYSHPEILVAEGNADRVFLGYVYDAGLLPAQAHVAWSNLDADTGDFSHDILLGTSLFDITGVSLATDANANADYVVYATWAATHDATGDDVYFARGITSGATWAPAYTIDEVIGTAFDDVSPVVTCGYNNWVHVAWTMEWDSQQTDIVLCYRRAGARAAGGQAAWDDLRRLSVNDGVDLSRLRIAAAPSAPFVLMVAARHVHDTSTPMGVGVLYSNSIGEAWAAVGSIGTGAVLPGDLLYDNGRWTLGVTEAGCWGYRVASNGTPGNWSPLLAFSVNDGAPSLALDPSRDNRVGLLGRSAVDDGELCVFDAEWRADPGYPNLEDGFPVDLAFTPTSDPAIVDVDGNGDLEIVFTDARGRICIYTQEGSPLPGWPVLVGTALSPAPVAIDDMDGDGQPEILVGTADGRAFGYDGTGTSLPGFPFNTGRAAPVYITIASVGGVLPRAAIVANGGTVVAIDNRGRYYPGALTHTLASTTITSTPAVGDIDGDGVDEVVVAASSTVWAFEIGAVHNELARTLEAAISGGITLADFDADGEVEIVAPLASGVLHVLQEDGTEFAGSWPVTVSTSALRGVAIADIRYLTTPEVAVTATNWTVALLNTTGGVPLGWPNDTDGWFIYGKPILGRIAGTSSSVVVGSRGYHGWAWGLLGGNVEGWPRTFDDHIELTPAYGDLDLDRRAEVVFLTTTQLAVFDVGTDPGENRATWPMAAHDPGRTGCWECSEDLVAVGDAPTGVTRVSFATPWPNPVSGPTSFDFALPVTAVVELAVYDLRGARVALVGRSELPAGRHQLAWNGHDRDGHPLASGHYLAALKVKGPGLDETLTRKFTVVH